MGFKVRKVGESGKSGGKKWRMLPPLSLHSHPSHVPGYIYIVQCLANNLKTLLCYC